MPKRSTLRLTTRSVAALPATGRDTVHWDRDLPGFGVRVQRNGRKVYVVQSRGPAGLNRSSLCRLALSDCFIEHFVGTRCTDSDYTASLTWSSSKAVR